MAKALVDLSATSKVKQKLGPSRELLAVLKLLGTSGTGPQTETIELRREAQSATSTSSSAAGR